MELPGSLSKYIAALDYYTKGRGSYLISARLVFNSLFSVRSLGYSLFVMIESFSSDDVSVAMPHRGCLFDRLVSVTLSYFFLSLQLLEALLTFGEYLLVLL